MAKMTNTNNGIAKMYAKLLCRMDYWPTKLKGCAKHVERRYRKHMECDGMSGDVINQDGKYWWYLMMQSMSKSKEEEKTVMSKALAPRKLMISCVGCMMSSDVLNLLLLCISGHNWNKEHTNVANRMDGSLV